MYHKRPRENNTFSRESDFQPPQSLTLVHRQSWDLRRHHRLGDHLANRQLYQLGNHNLEMRIRIKRVPPNGISLLAFGAAIGVPGAAEIRMGNYMIDNMVPNSGAVPGFATTKETSRSKKLDFILRV